MSKSEKLIVNNEKYKFKEFEGITLISLVITIIILIILAGVAINLTLGKNGILTKAKEAKDAMEIAQIKEKIEVAILEIQAETIENNKNFTMDILKENLPQKLESIIVGKDDNEQIVGEYKSYNFTITKEYEVIVEKRVIKPIVDYTLSIKETEINPVTITLTAKVSEGKIAKIIKPDGLAIYPNKDVIAIDYEANANEEYEFIVEASNGERTTTIVHVPHIKPLEPVIDSEKIYPILTLYGIERPKVKIAFEENENLENYYSEDNGTTWKIYQEEFTASGSTIMAKSVVKGNENCYTQVQLNVVAAEDALGIEAYDGNEETSISHFNNKYIMVSEEVINASIELMYYTHELGPTYMQLYFYNEQNEEISQIKKVNNFKGTDIIEIPNNTYKIKITVDGWNNWPADLYEIKIANMPTIIKEKIYYPTITEQGIKEGTKVSYDNISIQYFVTSVQKMYKIDEGEWRNYTNEDIHLEQGQTIYAKGIDIKGNESIISSYTANILDDALKIEAYDGDEETYVELKGAGPIEYYMNVSPEMQEKSIKVIRSMGIFTTYGLKYYNENDEEISSEMLEGLVYDLETEHVIPKETKKIGFYYSSSNNSDCGKIHEIYIRDPYSESPLYLYHEGNEYENLTGGYDIGYFTGTNPSTGTIEKCSNYIEIKSWGYWCQFGALTKKKINVTKYSKLKVDVFDCNYTDTSDGYEQFVISYGDTPTIIYRDDLKDTVYEVDISSLTGRYIIGIHAGNGCNAKVRSIWLEI